MLQSQQNPIEITIAEGDRPVRLFGGQWPGIAWSRSVRQLFRWDEALVIFVDEPSQPKEECPHRNNFSLSDIPVFEYSASANDAVAEEIDWKEWVSACLVKQGYLEESECDGSQLFAAIWDLIEETDYEILSLKHDIKELKADLKTKSDKFKAEVKSRSEQLARTSVEMFKLQKQLSQVGKEIPDANAIVELYVEKIAELERNIEQTKAELKDTQEELEEVKAKAATRKPATKEARQFFEIASNLLPEIDFRSHSLSDLYKNFQNPYPMLGRLIELQKQLNPEFKSIKGRAGKKGWKELVDHICDGQSNMGRIYLRASQAPGKRLEAFVHKKTDDKEQYRVFDALANAGLQTNKLYFIDTQFQTDDGSTS